MKARITILTLALVAMAAPDAAAAQACKPSKLTLERTGGTSKGTVRWKGSGTFTVTVNGRRAGSSSKGRLRVKTQLGRSYRVTVANGSCRATRRFRMRPMPPGTPRKLTVSVSGSEATVTWQKGPRGDGRLAGYRVYRDGKTVGQPKARKITMKSHGEKITVCARDTRGRMSQPATVSLTGGAPSAPSGLRAEGISETQVTLRWNAAKPGSGTIRGYRVFRDGAVLGQPADTTITVPRLHSGKAYSFSVAAVNSHGKVGAPSKSITVSTNPPPATTGTAHAFLLASTDASFAAFQASYQKVGVVYPTYFECDRQTAQIKGKDDPRITAYAKLRQVQVLARVDCQHGPTLHRILNEPALREQTLSGIVARVQEHGYDGVNLDFESGAAADRGAYTSFVSDLSARLHAIGKKLSVCVSAKVKDDPGHPRSGFYDYPALAAAADHVFVMAWGIHWSTSAPGPIADWPWFAQVVEYVRSLGNPGKYVIGVPLYSMDWPNGGGPQNMATARSFGDVMSVAASAGVAPQYDAASHESHFTYTDGNGVGHEVWLLSAPAVLERVNHARSLGYTVGLWRLGQEDPAIWAGF